jgi:tetratricopeptide (TPR) repeat protein
MRLKRALCLAVSVAAFALVGCGGPTVVRVIDGREIAGRFLSERAYALYAEAADAEARGELGAALSGFSAALGEDPDSVEILSRIGALRCRLGGDAEAAFERALSVNADYEPALRERAVCALRKGRVDEAIVSARLAVASDPTQDAAVLVLANALERRARVSEAKALLAELVVRRPTSIDAARAQHELALHMHDAPMVLASAGHLRSLGRHLVAETEGDASPSLSLAEIDAALASGDLPRARRLALHAKVEGADLAVRAVALGNALAAKQQAELIVGADPDNTTAVLALVVALDLLHDAAGMERALARPQRGRTTPLVRVLFAEMLARRLGDEVARAWLAAATPEGAPRVGDALLDATEGRLRARLGQPATTKSARGSLVGAAPSTRAAPQ